MCAVDYIQMLFNSNMGWSRLEADNIRYTLYILTYVGAGAQWKPAMPMNSGVNKRFLKEIRIEFVL